MKSFFGWVGGKSQLAPKIVKEFPKHHTYVEVFGGAGWVLFQKDQAQSKVEVYNDINGDLVNLMTVAKHRPSALSESMRNLLFSRQMMKRCLEPGDHLGEVDRASRFLYLIKNSFGAKLGAGWAMSRKSPPRTLINGELVQQVSERLKKVYIDHQGFGKLIPLWDSKQTLFYLDPPYSGDLGKHYQHQMALEDHEKLRRILGKAKGKWILSYDASPAIRKLYKGYRMKTLDIKYSLNNKTTKQTRQELLISNC
ncbi:MAG: DNA adenine methylase [Candidatus Nitronauta litoralis]|uniref:DNA adenine methylase n=1 Tax=Candidatus Nitronauta litoralis TaxID=2705533 RepID=A0A7T0BVC2_9BACT|nr:MAG: DNA adenine methylase [Candidatus Nitronauta litoralis]